MKTEDLIGSVGRRVRVVVANPKEWARNAAECLRGHTGVIQSYNDLPSVRVTFDAPLPKPWFANQLPPTGFNFEPKDLELIR